jgi:hypothetical protein
MHDDAPINKDPVKDVARRARAYQLRLHQYLHPSSS